MNADALQALREARDDKGRFVAGMPGPALKHGLRSATLADVPELAEVMRETIDAIETDLGGSANLSTLKKRAVREAARLSLIVDSLGDDLLANGVFTGKGRTRAALQAYGMALDRWHRLMSSLGFDRHAKDAPDLRAYLQERGQR